MHTSDCAPCRGVNGKGRGPVASALKTPLPGLTALARNDHGNFPNTHIVSALQNDAEIALRGTAEMPVGSPILAKMNQVNSQDGTLRISNLSRYLETIQGK